MAHGLDYGPGHGATATVVDGFLAALRTQRVEETEAVEIVKAMVSSVAHPEFWRKMLVAAAESPTWQIPVARVLASGALLVNSDTRSAAGKLMSALTSVLDGSDHAELLEAPIRRAAASFPPDASEWRERAVDQRLGCLDVAKIQDPKLQSRLERVLAAGDPPDIPEPGGVETFWEPLDLRDVVGAEVHDALTDTARSALDALRTALAATESDTAEVGALSDLVDALRQVMEADGRDAEPVHELITRAAERLGREPSVQPGTPVGDFVGRILIDAANRDPQP